MDERDVGASRFDRVGVAALVAAVAASVLLVALWGTTEGLGLARIVADRSIGHTSLWLFVPLVLLAARLAYSKFRLALAGAASLVTLLAAVRVQEQSSAGLLVLLSAITLAIGAAPMPWSRPLLYLLGGLVSFAALGLQLLPLPAAVLSIAAAVGYGREAHGRDPIGPWVVLGALVVLFALFWAANALT